MQHRAYLQEIVCFLYFFAILNFEVHDFCFINFSFHARSTQTGTTTFLTSKIHPLKQLRRSLKGFMKTKTNVQTETLATMYPTYSQFSYNVVFLCLFCLSYVLL